MTVTGSLRSKARKQQWIVCQIGAREHYVLAAELYRRQQLAALCTDVWVAKGSPWGYAANALGARGRNFRERYEPALQDARVFSETIWTLGMLSLRYGVGGTPLVGTELWQPIDGLQMAWRAVLRDLGYCARSWAVSLLFSTVMLLSKFLRPPNGLEASLSLDRSTPGRRKMLWSPDWLSVRNMSPVGRRELQNNTGVIGIASAISQML